MVLLGSCKPQAVGRQPVAHRLWWLAGILVVAAVARLWGIAHDLPYVYYYDETHLMNRAVGFGKGDLNPHWFHKPALYMYLLFAQFGAYFVFGRLTGMFGSVDAFAMHYVQDKTVFALLGRLTSAFCGIGCVVGVYLLGRRQYGERVGLVSAGFLAVTYAHVRSSQLVKADQLAALFSVLALIFIFRIAESGRWRDYLLASLFVGLGTASKYSPILLVVPLWVAHVQCWRRRDAAWWRRAFGPHVPAALAVVVTAFFVASPFNFLDPHWMRHNVLPLLGFGQDASVYTSYGLAAKTGFFTRVWLWIEVIFSREALGAPLAAAAGLGLLLMLARRRRQDVLVCVTVVWVLAAFVWRNYEPWLLNGLYPVLCVAAAVFVVAVAGACARRIGVLRARSGWAVACAALALAAPATVNAARFNCEQTLPDTRTLACRWIEANVPAGSRMVLDEFGPQLSASPESFAEELARAERLADTTPFTFHLVDYYQYRMRAAREDGYRILQISHVWWSGERRAEGLYEVRTMEDADYANPAKARGTLPLSAYIAQGYEYAVISSIRYKPYLHEERGDRFPGVRRFYEDLMAMEPLHEERALPGVSRGPTILVYRLPRPQGGGNR